MNNDKQLTPEEIAIKATENADKIQPKRWHIHWKGLWAGYIMGYTSAQDIHIQQTAAKDEELKYREQIIINKDLRIDEKISIIAKKDERIKELEEALSYERRVAHETSKDNADMIVKLNSNGARIAELEKSLTSAICQHQQVDIERDQLLEKVEQLEKELSKRTKERDLLAEVVVKDTEFVKTNQKAAIDMRIERDQAFDLLERIDWGNGTNWREDYQKFLSSRENKKPVTQQSQTIYKDMPKVVQEEIVKRSLEAASEILLRSFMACDLKTHIDTMVVNDATGEEFILSFRKVNKKPLELGGMRPGEPGAGGYDPNNPPPEPETIEEDERPYIVLLERWLSEKHAKGSRVHRDTAEYLHEYYKENPQGMNSVKSQRIPTKKEPPEYFKEVK